MEALLGRHPETLDRRRPRGDPQRISLLSLGGDPDGDPPSRNASHPRSPNGFPAAHFPRPMLRTDQGTSFQRPLKRRLHCLGVHTVLESPRSVGYGLQVLKGSHDHTAYDGQAIGTAFVQGVLGCVVVAPKGREVDDIHTRHTFP